jgi:hypothetical protein
VKRKGREDKKKEKKRNRFNSDQRKLNMTHTQKEKNQREEASRKGGEKTQITIILRGNRGD